MSLRCRAIVLLIKRFSGSDMLLRHVRDVLLASTWSRFLIGIVSSWLLWSWRWFLTLESRAVLCTDDGNRNSENWFCTRDKILERMSTTFISILNTRANFWIENRFTIKARRFRSQRKELKHQERNSVRLLLPSYLLQFEAKRWYKTLCQLLLTFITIDNRNCFTWFASSFFFRLVHFSSANGLRARENLLS